MRHWLSPPTAENDQGPTAEDDRWRLGTYTVTAELKRLLTVYYVSRTPCRITLTQSHVDTHDFFQRNHCFFCIKNRDRNSNMMGWARQWAVVAIWPGLWWGSSPKRIDVSNDHVGHVSHVCAGDSLSAYPYPRNVSNHLNSQHRVVL